MLRRRQCLPQHLSAKHLRAAYIAAIPAEDIFLYPLQLQQRNQIFENRVHRRSTHGAAAIDRYAGAADEAGVVAGEKQRDLGNVDRFAETMRRRIRDAEIP